jgi:hydroxymethylpyrimidine/phosphomethylpyrimidine kinase
MRAKGGDPLLAPEAVETLRSTLLPLAEIITPNLPEAEVLTGRSIRTIDEMKEAAHIIHAQGPRHVIVKGGHHTAEPIDIYFDGEYSVELHAERIVTLHTHGTGCTFSSAIVALLARGWPVGEAIAGAKQYITGAIRHAPGIGRGHGPVEHFWMYAEQGEATPLPTKEQHWSPWFSRKKERVHGGTGVH